MTWGVTQCTEQVLRSGLKFDLIYPTKKCLQTKCTGQDILDGQEKYCKDANSSALSLGSSGLKRMFL